VTRDRSLAEQLRGGSQGLVKRRRKSLLGRTLAALCLGLAMLFLALLVFDVLRRGLAELDWQFITTDVQGFQPEKGGVRNAIFGSVYLILITMAVAVPIGVAAAVYLEEFTEDNRFTKGLQRLIENLAGVPSIVFGLLGLAMFARLMNFGTSLLSGGLTLGLLVLPIVVVSTQEALSSVPDDFRNAARAMGATEWQVVKDHVLPAALPGIMTGSILALSRAIGETAPILFVVSSFVRGVPSALLDGFVALPYQIFYWAQQPSPTVQQMAASAIIVLLGLLLAMNAVAVAIRQWSLSRRHW
jgi:phosphate transport system permease protein